jgi:hypothetical protein
MSLSRRSADLAVRQVTSLYENLARANGSGDSFRFFGFGRSGISGAGAVDCGCWSLKCQALVIGVARPWYALAEIPLRICRNLRQIADSAAIFPSWAKAPVASERSQALGRSGQFAPARRP